MSSFTFADHKLGGTHHGCVRCGWAGHLNRAAGILATRLSTSLTRRPLTAGLLSEEAEAPAPVVRPEPPAPQLATSSQPIDMQMCARNVHAYGAPDQISGWRTCSTCGQVNVAPEDNKGTIDMSMRGSETAYPRQAPRRGCRAWWGANGGLERSET
jgi:hypothetical protein